MMAPIQLPCLVGGDCNFQTVKLEYEQAKAQQDGHMQYAHGAAAGAGGPRETCGGVAQAAGVAQPEARPGGWSHGTARARGRSAGQGRSPPGCWGEGRSKFERPRTPARRGACCALDAEEESMPSILLRRACELGSGGG